MAKKEFTELETLHMADQAYNKVSVVEENLEKAGIHNIHVVEKSPIEFGTTGMSATVFVKTDGGKTSYMVAVEGTYPKLLSLTAAKDLDDDFQIAINKIPEQTVHLERYINDVKARYNIKSPIEICGHSLGGTLAGIAAMQNPDAFSHVTMADSPGIKSYAESILKQPAQRQNFYSKLDIINNIPNEMICVDISI